MSYPFCYSIGYRLSVSPFFLVIALFLTCVLEFKCALFEFQCRIPFRLCYLLVPFVTYSQSRMYRPSFVPCHLRTGVRFLRTVTEYISLTGMIPNESHSHSTRIASIAKEIKEHHIGPTNGQFTCILTPMVNFTCI